MDKVNLDIRTNLINNEILHFNEIDSTNIYLLNTKELQNGTVALADYQTAGRGRMSRKWEATKDDALLFSIIINENLNQYHPAAFTFLTSIAVFEALKNLYYDIPISLKWPNDIISEGKKICGILVESRSSGNRLTKVVIGIGININQNYDFFQQESLQHGTSLKLITGQEGDRYNILGSILESLEQNLIFAQNRKITEILEKWKKYCPYIGKHIKLLENKNEHFGIFEDLNSEGGIILNQNGKFQTYYAADVTIDKDYL